MILRSRAGHGRQSERGVIGGMEAIPFGLLIFVSGALMMANAWAVVDAKMATDSASREAVRVMVESDGAGYGPAILAGEQAFQAHFGHLERLTITPIPPPQGFQRCARITITVTYRTRAVSVPIIGGFGSGLTVSSTHSEIVDPYRATLGEESLC